MNDKCGLINKSNPCRCPKKTKALKQSGYLDKDTMVFNINTTKKIKDYASKNHSELMETIEDKYTALFRDHPAKEDFGKKNVMDELLKDDDLRKYLQLN